MANGHKYTKEQDDFICQNYTNVSDCVRKFNEQFGTSLSYDALKSHANRKLKITTGFRPWTKEMDAAIETLLWHYPYEQATKIFNKQHGTKFTRKQVQDHCVKAGISRKQSEKLQQVDSIISANVNERSYGEIKNIVNTKMGTNYMCDTTICRRANNLGLKRPHRVWQKTDRRFVNGEEVSFSEYVRFIGNRWHRLTEELQPIALQVVRLQAVMKEREND